MKFRSQLCPIVQEKRGQTLQFTLEISNVRPDPMLFDPILFQGHIYLLLNFLKLGGYEISCDCSLLFNCWLFS